MVIYVKKIFDFHIIFFSGFLITILLYTQILYVSQLQTQKLMMPQIESHIEHFIQTYNIVLLFLYSH